MSVRHAFAQQATACERLGSPFMGRLLRGLAGRLTPDTAVGERVLRWKGNPGGKADSVPLRLAGGLHALVLSHRAPALAALYPPNEASDARLLAAVEEVCATHAAFLLDWLTSPPQTNEVRRFSWPLGALGAKSRDCHPGKNRSLWTLSKCAA